MEGRKQYIAEFTLGMQTDTGDDSGSIVKTMPVPPLDEAELKAVLQQFTGVQMQLPPMYSAIKINGQKLYQLARRGVEVERTARQIEVYKLELLHWTADKFTVAVECSKGTYIRVLGEDIAAALGSCGTMSFLLRTQVGCYELADAHTLQEIAADPEGCLMPPVSAVAGMTQLALTGRQAERITNGVRTTVAAAAALAGRCVLIGPGGEFLGIGSAESGMVQADKIFAHYKAENDKIKDNTTEAATQSVQGE